MQKNIFRILSICIIMIFIIGNISFVNAKETVAEIDESAVAEDITENCILVGTIYKQPKKEDSTDAGKSLDDSINDADSFIQEGEVKYGNGLSDVSNTIYNILLTVGVIAAVLIGAVIGIKLMVSGIEGKVEAKQLLVPYVVGCVMIFCGFGIWKLIVTILQNV